MGLFVTQASLKRIALTDPNQSKRFHAVEKLTDQDTLCKIALNDSDSHVRANAIRRVDDPLTLLHVALKENGSNCETAINRFCQVTDPKSFFPMLASICCPSCESGYKETVRIAVEGGCLSERLAAVNDIALLDALIKKCEAKAFNVSGYSKEVWKKKRDVVVTRKQELMKMQAQESSDKRASRITTDEERGQFVLDSSNSLDARLSIMEEITDDRVLSTIIEESPIAIDKISLIAAEQMRDAAMLSETFGRAFDRKKDKPLFKEWNYSMYSILLQKCPEYTPEFVLSDARAPEPFIINAMKKVEPEKLNAIKADIADGKRFCSKEISIELGKLTDDQEFLVNLAIRTDDSDILTLITDRDLLRRAAESKAGLRFRWCAAWRTKDIDMIREIESVCEKRVNGHAVIVTKHREWECHEEMCLRCGSVCGQTDDSESTHHYGKPFTSFPCRPDFPQL